MYCQKLQAYFPSSNELLDNVLSMKFICTHSIKHKLFAADCVEPHLPEYYEESLHLKWFFETSSGYSEYNTKPCVMKACCNTRAIDQYRLQKTILPITHLCNYWGSEETLWTDQSSIIALSSFLERTFNIISWTSSYFGKILCLFCLMLHMLCGNKWRKQPEAEKDINVF